MSEFFKPEDFPFIDDSQTTRCVIKTANRLLKERATVVYSRGGPQPGMIGYWSDRKYSEHTELVIGYWSDRKYSEHTELGKEESKELAHTALLICIEPIVKDSAEGLLREFIKIRTDNSPTGLRLEELTERARKLLGE